ncbi:porin [Caballeronia udeis]|uniref:Porin n=1 Tax=Caballeronia udeis TaxID=1232866 RepID=A0A158J4L8_9BURK|nr:porin [Caballeronia udeis]SAL63309.1 porin [Caballeronia udeis]
MKKVLLAATVSGLFAVAAHAQSSVTLYGVIDAGVVYANNSHTPGSASSGQSWGVGSGNVSNTLWGLRGSEDLGGGMHAIFKLENGFNVNNGALTQSNSIFGRQAYVGLQSNQYGTVTLGKQYDSTVDYLAPLSEAGQGLGNNLAAHPFDNDNLDNSFSISNSVKFASIDYAGFKFGGLYGFSNKAGAFSDNRAYSAGASYANGPLSIAASYLQINNPGQGDNPNGAVSGANNTATFVAARQRTFGGGVNYAFGPATVGFVYTHTKLDGLDAINMNDGSTALSGNSLRLDNYEVNTRYALTPAMSLEGAYTFTNGSFSTAAGDAKPKYHQFSLLADYDLSKRTDVYAEGVFQHASGGNGTVLGDADINGLSPSTTNKQVAVTVGMRHRF